MRIPLEFEGARQLPAWFNGGYDCRICMVLRGEQEIVYQERTGRKDTWSADGRLSYHVMRIQVGEMVICLPDHSYAHADHDHVERVLYAEMLEARLPKDDYERLDVAAWAARTKIR
jgi:hypothetical protein